MTKRKVRCFIAYVKVENVYNNKVYYLVQEGWANLSLATCINCGELFTIDWENPDTKNLSLKDIAQEYDCPKCSKSLEDTIRAYPETFRTDNRKIGSFTQPKTIPPDQESIIIEVWELFPKTS